MPVTVRIWTAQQAPTEAALRQIYAAESLQPYAWSNAPSDTYSPHTHRTHKVLYVVCRTITFGLPVEHRAVTLHPGDRLDLPSGTQHDAVVGPDCVTCLEAHRGEG